MRFEAIREDARRQVLRLAATLLVVLFAPPAQPADPLGPDAQMHITLLAEDVAKLRPGKQRRALEEDLRAAYAEYAFARRTLAAGHATTLARLDGLAADPALATPVLAARAARYAPGSPYADPETSHYLGLRTFYADAPAVWRRVTQSFDRAYQGPG
jgi:hypothetical protein